ncbi:MAG: hypothetical protein ACE5HU_05415 [Acidobacteriota bacterium]
MRTTRSSPRLAVLAAMGAFLLPVGVMRVENGHARTRLPDDQPRVQAVPPGCSSTADRVFKSCRKTASGKYRQAVHRCEVLLDGGNQLICSENAFVVMLNARGRCDKQRAARRQVCDSLGEAPYDPPVAPENFVRSIDNPFLPCVPGTARAYEGETVDGMARRVLEVTSDVHRILGVVCTVVKEHLYLNGVLTRQSYAYFAQDTQGNVWSFGRLSYGLEKKVFVRREDSWEAGVNAAAPGIVMPAVPRVGDVHRRNYLPAKLEDMSAIVSLQESVRVPLGRFARCLEIEDWTPIEPDIVVDRFYAPGIGLILEVDAVTGSRLELVDMSGSPPSPPSADVPARSPRAVVNHLP